MSRGVKPILHGKVVKCRRSHWPSLADIAHNGRLEEEALFVAVPIEDVDVVLQACAHWGDSPLLRRVLGSHEG